MPQRLSRFLFIAGVFLTLILVAGAVLASESENIANEVAPAVSTPWWVWPLALFVTTFILGIIAVLGGGNFVEGILKKTEDEGEKVASVSIDEVIKRVCEYYKVEPEKIINRKKQKRLSKKAVIVNIGIDKLGIPGSRIAKKLGLSKSAISKLNRMGEVTVKKEKEVLDKVLGKR